MKNKNNELDDINISFNIALLIFYLIAIITVIVGGFFIIKIANIM